MVQYAYASISEKGSVNGKKGDQTTKEVKIKGEYNFGQTWVIIPKDDNIARRIGIAAKRIAKNDCFGYGQSDRTSSYTVCKATGWHISQINAIKTKCNTDCSMLAGLAINFAYNKSLIPSSVYSGNFTELTAGKHPSKFNKVPYKKGMELKAGYIVGKNGHVTVVIEGGTAKV